MGTGWLEVTAAFLRFSSSLAGGLATAISITSLLVWLSQPQATPFQSAIFFSSDPAFGRVAGVDAVSSG